MEYGPSDSSGTDDDLPPPHQNRGTRGRIAVNGRTGVTLPYTTRAQLDMEAEIHQLEQEAYSSVLRAFKAQSDLLTWEKETLITELRTELKVSDIEHRELLSMVNADDLIRRIREWRKTGGRQPGLTNHAQPVPDPLPSPSVSGSRKRKATSQSIPSLSLTVPSPAMHPQPIGASMQPISAVKHGPLGTKGKKPKPNPSTGITGRGHLSNRGVPGVIAANELVETAAYDPLIGRKVMTRWPEDNNFYEAVITDYDPQKRLHALVYDINTNNETWEWVNLKEISPEDIRWESEDPGFQNRGVRGGAGRGIKKPPGRSGNVIPSGLGRGRGPLKHQSKKDLRISQNGIGKRGSDDIELLNTDSLLKEVERIFSASPLDLVEVEKAKKVLKEHEQALIDAISRLAEASDGESADCDQSFP